MKKIYLKTPEEVIKALKEGKTVEDKFGFKYKMIEGVIVSKRTNCYIIGDCMQQDAKPCISEEKSFKIEEGKFYETRSGKKAFCFRVNDEGKCYVCSIAIMGESGFYEVTKNGKFFFNERDEHPWDIIGPWEE